MCTLAQTEAVIGMLSEAKSERARQPETEIERYRGHSRTATSASNAVWR
jgi:hypothetical protein